MLDSAPELVLARRLKAFLQKVTLERGFQQPLSKRSLGFDCFSIIGTEEMPQDFRHKNSRSRREKGKRIGNENSLKNMVQKQCQECEWLFLRLYRHLVNQPRNTAPDNSLCVLCSYASGYMFLHLHTQPSKHATCRSFLTLQSSASAHILLFIRGYVMEKSSTHILQIKMC